MSDNSKHIYKGVVGNVDNGYADVALNGEVKCSGCALSSACGSRPEGRVVRVRIGHRKDLQVGQEVSVCCPPGSSNSAMLWGIVIPCVLIIAVSVILSFCKVPDRIVAIAGLGSVGLYYLVLFVFRKRLGRRLEWTLSD